MTYDFSEFWFTSIKSNKKNCKIFYNLNLLKKKHFQILKSVKEKDLIFKI